MKYTPGLLVGQLSGSAGSTVASHNRNGQYFRVRTIPVNPDTPRQSVVRTNVQELSQQYRSLTEAQRTAWGSLGDQMTRIDHLGNSYTLSGLQAYMSVNINRRTLSLADVTTAPAMTTVSILAGVTSTYTAIGGFDVIFTSTPLDAGEHLVAFATGPMSPGRNFAGKGQYRLIQVGADATASPLDITTNWVAKFGAPVNGQKIFVKAVVINEAGFAGDPVTLQVIKA